MNRHFETLTIRYYNDQADEYVRETVGVNMDSLYEPFLSLVPHNGRILDAGCGSGRDSKAFLDRGYQVASMDASQKMVDATTSLTKQPAQLLAFQEITFSEEFDGIWACASLLHVPLEELSSVFRKLALALRPSGVLYASFKLGGGERRQNGRLFTDMDETRLDAMVASMGELELICLWQSDDWRPKSNGRWLNVLLRNI